MKLLFKSVFLLLFIICYNTILFEKSLNSLYACNGWDADPEINDPDYPDDDEGDPVKIISGALSLKETDINIAGRGFPITFQRIYKAGTKGISMLGNWDCNVNITAKLNIAPLGRVVDMKKYSDGKSYEIYPRILISFEIKTPKGVSTIFNKEKSYFWAPNKDNPTVSDIMNLLDDGEEITNPENEFSFWGIPERLKTANVTVESLGAAHSKVFKNSDNTITWRKKDGTEFTFSIFTGDLNRIGGGDNSPWRNQPVAKILSIEDRNDNQLTFQYNNSDYNLSSNKIISITDPSNRQLTFTYSTDYVEVTDNISRVWKYYLSGGRLIKVVDPLNNYVIYEYDGNGDLTKLTNKRGYSWSFAYDSDNRQISSTNPLGDVITTYYSTYTVVSPFIDISGGIPENAKKYNETKFTYSNGNSEVFTYDPTQGIVVKRLDMSGLATLYQCDSAGNIVKIIARKNASDIRVMKYIYDNYGNCTRAILPMGNEYKWTYENTFNKPTAFYDPVASTTTYTYDSKGNLTEITDPENNKSTFTYNSYGEITAITNARGCTTTFEYNSYGYATKITNALGNSMDFVYDNIGRMTSNTDALNQTTSYEYDDLGRLTKITDNQNNITQNEYDANGNLIKITDANGNLMNYEYDGMNRLVKVTDDLNNITQYEWDSIGNLTKMIDARGNATTYEYEKALNISTKLDKLRHDYQVKYLLTKKVDQIGNPQNYFYDNLGNLTSIEDANGDTVNFTFNNNDLCTQLTFGGTSISYGYNDNAQRISVTDSNGTISYTYDKRNNVKQVSYSGNKTVKYSYNETGQRAQIIYPDSSTVNYSYDALNRVSAVSDFAGNTSTYTYNEVGRSSAVFYVNGVTAECKYDSLNRLTWFGYQAGTTTIYRSTYTYDSIGNKLTKTFADGDKWEYEYDDLYRLSKAVKKTSSGTIVISHEYTHDAASNRAGLTDLSGSDSYTNDSDNRLMSVNGTTFGYDNNGNMTSKTVGAQTTSFEYDYRNQLVKITYPDASENTFGYDPYGRRTEKTDSAGTKKYIWDGIKPISEYDGSDNLKDKYAYGTRRRVISRKVESSGSVYFYHQDDLGSIVKITNSSGTVVNSYDYDDYGNIINQTEGIVNDYTYTGKERDKDSGLYYYGVRYCKKDVGRFITKDSLFGLLLYPATLNKYLFVLNNPIKYIDVWGNEAEDPYDAHADDTSDPSDNEPGPGGGGGGFYPFNQPGVPPPSDK